MTIKTNYRGFIALAGLATLQAYAGAPASVTADLVTHNEIIIESAPANIWPHIINTDAWKKATKRYSIGGEPGQVGERFKVVAADNPQKLVYYIETVEIVAQRRRTIRLNAPDGALIGFASWQLIPQNGSTLVQYDVYCEGEVEPATQSPLDVSAAKKNYHDVNFQRFNNEFSVLKKLVEGSR